MSGGIYSVACSFGLFISGFWSWQPYIIFSLCKVKQARRNDFCKTTY